MGKADTKNHGRLFSESIMPVLVQQSGESGPKKTGILVVSALHANEREQRGRAGGKLKRPNRQKKKQNCPHVREGEKRGSREDYPAHHVTWG